MTLVEVALAICIGGVLLAVFVPTFIREIRTSKVAEAAQNLALLHERTSAYFGAEHDVRVLEASARGEADQEELDPETETRLARHCLPPSAGPTPVDPPVQPLVVDFGSSEPGDEAAETSAVTWAALGFAPEGALRYRYRYFAASAGCELDNPVEGPLVNLQAEGDLDADGYLSLFERSSHVGSNGELVPFQILFTRDRLE